MYVIYEQLFTSLHGLGLIYMHIIILFPFFLWLASRFACKRSEQIIVFFYSTADSSPVRVVYVPSHLYHILFELFKNAMRAVVENHSNDDVDNLPPLEMLLVMGDEDLTIKVNDS